MTGTVPPPSRKRATIRPEDERRLALADARLESACESIDSAVAQASEFSDAIDSDRIAPDGVVIAPMDDGDSLVIHVEDGLKSAQPDGQTRGRP